MEVKARWAYGEINSTRFRAHYPRVLAPTILQLAASKAPFSAVQHQAWPSLVAALKGARNPRFVDNLDQASFYECSAWTIQDLLNATTIPNFRSLPYWKFLAFPPELPGSQIVLSDPRQAAHAIPYDPDFRVQEPLISIVQGEQKILLEGYLRSILWLRNPIHDLLIWVPRQQTTFEATL